MSSSDVLIHQPPPQEEQHYTPSHHHDDAGTTVVNEMDYRSIDNYGYEPVAQSTMTGAVYHHHHDESSSRILQAPVEALQAYANVVEAATACAVAVTTEDVLEAAMEGYDNNDSNKRPLEDSTSDQDPNKRLRTSEVLFAAPKKVNNEQWDNMFERLKKYKAEHGDCLVPKRYVADPKLGTWVETQVRNKEYFLE
jgi:rubrerythrin